MATQNASRYLQLIERFPLRPIRDDAQLDRAIAIINGLLDQGQRSGDEADYLDVLSTLVEQYEEVRYPTPEATGAEMLAHLIEDRGLSQAEVAEGAGLGISTVSEILLGRRKLNTRHIASLARFFKVDPGLFIDG
jgi:HTH-type transcriptional regulator/antitoxin HigA